MPAEVLKTARTRLPDVTLVAVTSVALDATVRALLLSLEQASFGATLLLSSSRPSILPDGIEWRQIAQLKSRNDYSDFVLRQLAFHIETPFALVVQWDGYVLKGCSWQDTFRQYDYIGAPWPQFDDGHTVGNGGFSLRSKRLLHATSDLPDGGREAEDTLICRTHRHWLETNQAIRFAPEAVARQFAYERTPRQGAEFGFHGIFNMMHDLPRKEFGDVLASLEPGLLGRRERRDVFRHALRNGRLRILINILKRRRSG